MTGRISRYESGEMSRKADQEDRRITREAIKKYGDKYNVSCDIANEYGSASDEDIEYEDACYTSGINTHEGTGKATAKALLRSPPHNGTQLYGITIEYVVSCTCYHPVHKCDA